MKFKELFKAIIFQLKRKHAFKNIFVTHNAWGIFSPNSHWNDHCNKGKEKIIFPSYESARKCADKMEKKRDCHFSVYKCAYCDGFHMGRNKENSSK